jgi:NADPH:quinone reductase-like Zn-dependent oxidoreductase
VTSTASATTRRTATVVVADRFGGPEVLRRAEVPLREPGPREVRIRVHATGLNPADVMAVAGQPFFLRFTGLGLFRPRHPVPGSDVAGRIEAVGDEVTRFRPGDEVYGNLADVGRGGLADVIVAPEEVWAPAPVGLDPAAAAAVPMAGVTALQGLRDHGGLTPGMRVLIIGASGGVGGFAVQIAKAHGAHVTGVASTGNLERVRSLGADEVVDYRTQDVAALGRRFDLVFATVADLSVQAYQGLLEPEGTFVTTGFLPALAMRRARPGEPRMLNMVSTPSADDLAALTPMLEDGRIVPDVDRRFPFRDAVDALREQAEGRARGKLVVTMDRVAA